MASESVSFRITRNTEDLAQTIHALSQRLVTLEKRLEAMQLQLDHRLAEQAEPDIQALASLDNVERLLHDCRCLLGLDGSDGEMAEQQPVAEELVEAEPEASSVPELAVEDVPSDRVVVPSSGPEREDGGGGMVGEPFSQAA